MIIAKKLEPIRSAEKCVDFRDFIDTIAAKYGEKTAFVLKHKQGKEVSYENISFLDLQSDVRALGTFMISKGYHEKRIAIIGENKYPWFLTYLAALYIGGIVVPLDKGLAYPEFESSVMRSYADVVVYDKKHASLVEELKASGNSKADTFFCMEDGIEDLSIKTLISEGSLILEKGEDLLSKTSIDPDGIGVILFTSGTTSLAKAVMLSQDNILSNLYDMDLVEDIRATDVNMAFLPYHHTFGSTGQLVMLNCGAKTAYCDGLKYIQKNLVEYKVSVFVCVPLLIESIYKKVLATAKKNGLEKKLAFGRKLSSFLLALGIDARRKIFKSVIDQLGGELRLVISGAAAIEPETLIGFNGFGILAISGYGMTESAPVLAAENTVNRKNGSIGKSMPSVEIRIDEPNEEGVGELIAKGPNVMLGYYENEEETNNVIVDGWLHTGDLAYIDKDGFIFICGRKKNVIVLKNGKNVFPEEIELLISELEYVEENFVFSLPKAHDPSDQTLYVKIVYNKDYFGDKSAQEIDAIVTADLEKINDTMPNYKQIHNHILSTEPMIKTTTAKVKRHEEIEVIKKELGL